MNISEVNTATYVGKFSLNENSSVKRNLNFEYALNKEEKFKEGGRVYLIVVNGEIFKIGGSQSKGGISSTLGFYISGNTGRPSIRTYGINYLIEKELKKQNLVEVYMIQSELITAPVCGLFGSEMEEVSAFKEMETKCVNQYVNVMKKHPVWNFQEAGLKWEDDVQESYNYYMNKVKGYTA
jgi:hypothetical protein